MCLSGSNPIQIGNHGLNLKVKVTATQYSNFLHNYLLTSLLYISALFYQIKMKFDKSLMYALCRFVFEFHKMRMGDDIIMMSFKSSAYNFPYFKFYWTNKLHILYQWSKANGQRSNIIQNKQNIIFQILGLFLLQISYLVTRYSTIETNGIQLSLLDLRDLELSLRSRSNVADK